MIYILDHYYAVNHKEWCLIVESDKTEQEVIEITSALTFLFEDIVDVSACLDNNCLLKLLVTYYGMKDIKAERFCEEMLDTIDDMMLPINGVSKKVYVGVDGIAVEKAVIIDLYGARESCCGPDYKKMYDKYLPVGERLEEIKALLLTEGEEH